MAVPSRALNSEGPREALRELTQPRSQAKGYDAGLRGLCSAALPLPRQYRAESRKPIPAPTSTANGPIVNT